MKRKVLFVMCLPSQVAKSITNIERKVNRQNTVMVLLFIGLGVTFDILNTQSKKLKNVYDELEALKNEKGE